ncbi:MAG: PfkB family carbohydrate kinase [Elusimicrobiota bacterium]
MKKTSAAKKKRVVDARRSPKIKTLKELRRIIRASRRRGRRVALCHGVFDLLHPGHIVHFQEARSHGDLLVVSLTPDRYVNKGPGRPFFPEALRMESLAAIESVDYVVLNEWPTATKMLKLLQPNFYVKGGDYADARKDLTGKIVEEAEAMRSFGGRLVFTEGFTSSSSRLLNRFFSVYPKATQEYLHAFRREYTADEVVGHLKGLRDLRVLVVGEAILDQYTYCLPLGKSPKETIVSTKFLSDELFAGGAVATANHIAGLCKEVVLLTALGEDQAQEKFVRRKLKGNVRLELMRTMDRPSVRKRRFISSPEMRKMFEIQFLNDEPLQTRDEKVFARMLQQQLRSCDLVVVNDFGHGLLTEGLRRDLSRCRRFLALNTQSNSANLGFNEITKYSRADYVSIDELELRLAWGEKHFEIDAMTKALRRRIGAQKFLVSRGAKGSVIHDRAGFHVSPALATRIVDRIGAGDALFAVTSPLAYKKTPSDILGFIGNCVGALAVEIVCNRESIEPVPLFKFVETLLK